MANSSPGAASLSCSDPDLQAFETARLGSVTVNALQRTGRARLSLPSTEDVVIIDATAVIVTFQLIDATTRALFRMVTGFDPCVGQEPDVYALLTPRPILAWREVHEMHQRDIMRYGRLTTGVRCLNERESGRA